ncbi:MAG TPA: Asp-tRNA(Asn)/Glu-tRNA(Gln) amidotransferase subunit GatB [Candidatus Saccharimonadia bacterium]|nr:Asp-tRNA(Asn)/Glu-tRNA(Gln) amidotransferase subunit GatB [Candidatus Saccharimonadia bacterium]
MIKNSTKYYPTIGIECHVQLKTRTKLFAAVTISDSEDQPNIATSHICFGMPGALPVLNEEAIHLAIKAAFALGTEPQKFSKFDRKHYFYPDLPKGYQITQYDQPIIIGGKVKIHTKNGDRSINITRAHLEEDAGKTIHPTGKDYSLVDLNRAGVPLLEIVSEPELHSPEEAREYAHELYLLMRYADVSDANLYLGNMRFDINVSVSKTKGVLGTRSETKNLNSFKSVEKAAEYEINRQIKELELGKQIIQETRGWDDSKQKTFSQRTKEDAHDYRYFPEPDVPPVLLDDKTIAKIKLEAKILPGDVRSLLSGLDLDESTIEMVVDEISVAEFTIKILKKYDKSVTKKVIHWLTSDVQGYVVENKLSWDDIILNEDSFKTLTDLVKDNKVSSTNAKVILIEMIKNNSKPNDVARSMNLLQISGDQILLPIIRKVILDNKKAVEDLKSGEQKAMGFLVGQAMKLSKGQANPSLSADMIKHELGL